MNPIYKLRHKIQMLKDFLQLLSTGPVTLGLDRVKNEMSCPLSGFSLGS